MAAWPAPWAAAALWAPSDAGRPPVGSVAPPVAEPQASSAAAESAELLVGQVVLPVPLDAAGSARLDALPRRQMGPAAEAAGAERREPVAEGLPPKPELRPQAQAQQLADAAAA